MVSALYIHKKHFPGWITKQFVLKQLYESYWRRRNVIQPWNPFVQTFKLIRANRIVNKKLREARNAGNLNRSATEGATAGGHASEARRAD